MINLSKHQSSVFDCSVRHRVLVTGRRFGKSFLGIVELIIAATRKKNQYCLALFPSYTQARSVGWQQIIKMIPPHIIAGKPNISRMEITLTNGSVIQFAGAGNPETFRGLSLNFLWIDEVASLEHIKDIWQAILRPALSDKLGRALFSTSPNGYNFAYDLYQRGLDDDEKQFKSFSFTTLEGGFVNETEIADAKSDMPTNLFNQEYLASFESLSGRVYYNFDHLNSLSDDFILRNDDIIHIGQDFNVANMTACLAVVRTAVDNNIKKEIHIFDEIVLVDSNTQTMCDTINKRYPNNPKISYPDASGSARSTSSSSNDHIIIEQSGIRVQAPAANPRISARVNTVNAALLSANQETRRLYINRRCKHVIKSLNGQTYDKAQKPDKTGNLDHMADALGYMICALLPISHYKTSYRKL